MLLVSGFLAGSLGLALVERQLAEAVDGVLGVVGLLGHTVAGAEEHQAAAVDTAEVGTLQGVEDAALIDVVAVLLPVVYVVVPVLVYILDGTGVCRGIIDEQLPELL